MSEIWLSTLDTGRHLNAPAEPRGSPRRLQALVRRWCAALCRKANEFKLCRTINASEDLVNTTEHAILDQILRTIPTLPYRKLLEDDDGLLAHLEWQITVDRLQLGSTDRTLHR